MLKAIFTLIVFMNPSEPTLVVEGNFDTRYACESLGEAMTKDTTDRDYLCVQSWYFTDVN